VSGLAFEVCTENVVGVRAAEKAGAHRAELCSALAEGGVTPSLGLFKAAREKTEIPIHVLVRPRGGDFGYTSTELAVMLEDIALFKEAGADGLVFGVLGKDGSLALPEMTRLMEAADPLPVTFHRAFDVCRDPFKVLEQLIALGVARLLTSGQARDALTGAKLIRTLVEQAGDRLVVMAGGGVRSANAAQIVRDTLVAELHFSAQRPVQPSLLPFAFGSPAFTDEASIAALIRSVS
jgi:copper homeostasis protein